jgi:hypothetical protein
MVAKLGLITTGQGPRNEYVHFHRKLMKELGVDVEIKIRNAMDGLSVEEIQAMTARPGDRWIASHYHLPGATGDRMGPGWALIYTDTKPLIPLFQKCMDSLEADGVDVTILLCAEEYPLDAFHSKRPLLVPWVLMTEWVRVSTMCMAEPKVGILIPDQEHWEEDTATWRSQPWMKNLKVVFEIRKGHLAEACARFQREKVDFVINWGYGFGIAPGDSPDTIKSMEEAIGAPFLTPQRLVALHVRNLLMPSLNDRRFAGENVKNPPGAPPEV